MNLGKSLKKLKSSHYVFILLVLSLGFILYQYGVSKSTFSEKYEGSNNQRMNPSSLNQESNEYERNNNYATVENTMGEVPNSSNVPSINPSELLPKDENNAWSELNPNAPNSIEVNLLKPMLNQVNRNPNLQLRSDVPNPQGSVGPWNNTTITPDQGRLQFEIGAPQ